MTPIDVYTALPKSFIIIIIYIITHLWVYKFSNIFSKNYLSIRKQFIEINNAKCFEADITKGVS